MQTPNLTIRSLRSTAVSVPMARPLVTSVQTVSSAPLLLVDLETEQGVTGRAYLFDIACWDALAVAAGLPLANFWGGNRRASAYAPRVQSENVLGNSCS